MSWDGLSRTECTHIYVSLRLSACLGIGLAEQIICIFRWVPLVCVAERIKRFRGGCVLREEVFADGLKVIAFSDWPNPLPGSWITQV